MDQRTLLFTDIVDSTKIVQRLGDRASAALWAEHDRHSRALLLEHRGLEIDRSDGFLLVFDGVRAAALFSIAYHAATTSLGLAARVGIHHGSVSLRRNPLEAVALGAKPIEVDGLAKPLAARVMSLAAGGQTLLSAVAADALRSGLPSGQELRCHGHYRLKGIDEPLALFELGDQRCGFVPPVDADKAYRVIPEGDVWRPVRSVPHNLAPERDAFVGRLAELRQLAGTLESGTRLLSVLGVGGTGKTRLARRYARSWLGDWPGGVYFCDLSNARTLEGLCFSAASALDLSLGRGDPVERLGHAIAGRGRCLVVLDNFEQVVGLAAETVGRWLDRADEAAFVVTSRERLQLPGEAVLLLDPLPSDGDAVELFVVRARAQRPGFELDTGTRASVQQIVRLLDGLPLAIELAAARTRVLSPAQILQRLTNRFTLLAGARGATERQATLKAAIDWSWDLLAPWEQAGLAQCSVFEGSFTMEAAEAVLDLRAWPEAPPAMDVVQSLVDKSLVRAWQPAVANRLVIDEPYFGLFLSIHEYADDRLRADERLWTSSLERHGQYYARYGTDEAIRVVHRAGATRARAALAADIENLVVACRRALESGSIEVAAATLRAAYRVLSIRGAAGVGVALGNQLLDRGGLSSRLRAAIGINCGRGLITMGRLEQASSTLLAALAEARSAGSRSQESSALAFYGACCADMGHMDQAMEALEASVALSRAIGDRAQEGDQLSKLGMIQHMMGDTARARPTYEAAIEALRAEDDRVEEGIALGNLACLHRDQGRLDEAEATHHAALQIHRDIGSRYGEGVVLGNLGILSRDRGRLDEAAEQIQAALQIDRELGDRPNEAVDLSALGDIRCDQDRLDDAAAHFETALAIAREVGNRRIECMALGSLGDIHRRAGRWETAVARCEEGLAVCRQAGYRGNEGILQVRIAEVYVALGRTAEALAALEAAEPILRDSDNPIELARLLCVRARVKGGQGDEDVARTLLGQVEAMAVSSEAGLRSPLGQSMAELRAMLGRSPAGPVH